MPGRHAGRFQTHLATDSSVGVSMHLHSQSHRHQVQDDRWKPLPSDDVQGLCIPRQHYQITLSPRKLHVTLTVTA